MAGAMQRAKPDIKIILMTAYDVTPNDLESNLPNSKVQRHSQKAVQDLGNLQCGKKTGANFVLI